MPSTKRDHLIDTALELFSRDGFQATGIDKILKESGVAKMTLYNHFKSKDELILAVLRRRDETFRNHYFPHHPPLSPDCLYKKWRFSIKYPPGIKFSEKSV